MQDKSREEKTKYARAKAGTTQELENTRIHKAKGKTTQGNIRQDKTKQENTRIHKAKGKTTQGNIRQDNTKQHNTKDKDKSQDETRQNK